MAVEVWHRILQQTKYGYLAFMSVVNEAPWWQNSHITRRSHEPSPRFSSLLWMLTDVLCSNIPASSQVAPIAPVDPSCHIQSYISRHHNGKKNCKIMCAWALPINTTRSLTGSNSWFVMPYLLTTSAKLCIAKKKKLWPPPPPPMGVLRAKLLLREHSPQSFDPVGKTSGAAVQNLA